MPRRSASAAPLTLQRRLRNRLRTASRSPVVAHLNRQLREGSRRGQRLHRSREHRLTQSRMARLSSRQNLQERGFAGGKRQFIVRSSQKGRSRERLFCCPKSIPPGLTFRSLASTYVHCLLCTVRCILPPQTSSPLACEFNLRVRTASSLPIKMLRGALRMNAVVCRFVRRFLVLPLVLIVFRARSGPRRARPDDLDRWPQARVHYASRRARNEDSLPAHAPCKRNVRRRRGRHLAHRHLSQPHHADHRRLARRARHLQQSRIRSLPALFSKRGTGMLRRFACPRSGRLRTTPACARRASDGR